MTLIVILFIAGVLFIAAEVFLPGGIVGSIGGISMIGGIVMSYSEFGPIGAIISTAVAITLVTIALLFEFKFLPKTPMGKHLFLGSSVEGATEYSNADDDVIGQICETITALGPTGVVLLDGKKLEAASRSGFIEKNEQVKVTGRDNFRIIVSKL